MTPRSLGLFVKKLQPKVGLVGYDILFTYFVVEAKSKIILELPLRHCVFGYFYILLMTCLHQTFTDCVTNQYTHFAMLT